MRRRSTRHELRNRAISRLAEHPALTHRMLSALRASQVRQGTHGRLEIAMGRGVVVSLGYSATQALLEYTEARRIWGQPVSLFGLSRHGIRTTLYRRRKGLAA